MKPIRVLSIGAGAIGTYIGGSLALQGHEVSFVERPQVIEQLQAREMKLNLNGQDHFLPAPQMFATLSEAIHQKDFDVAIFALKSFDTPTFILNTLAEISNTDLLPPFLCLSNGVSNEPALSDAFGKEKVIAGTVTTAVGRNAAGDIVCERLRGVGVAGDHPLSDRLVVAMDAAGLQAQLFANAADMKWSKMLTNLIANATSAILDMSPLEIFAHPKLYQLEINQLREALAVMRAQNIKVVDLPGTPVRLLAFAAKILPLAVSRPFLKKAVGGGRGGKMPSFHIDLHSGRGESEVAYLNGAVMKSGAELGIPTPVNHLLTETLLKLSNREIPLDTYARKPDRLLALL